MTTLIRTGLFIAVAFLSGCATYIAPGAKADLAHFATGDIKASFEKKPSCPFPATLVAVRLQAPDYSNFRHPRRLEETTRQFQVITTREAEEGTDLSALQKLPQLQGIATLNSLLIPRQIDSEEEVRAAAAKVQGDLVFVYTFDTAFVDVDKAKPLSAITLGFSPTRKIEVTTTLSGLLLDTRTGYVYAVFENTVRRKGHSTSWDAADKADEERRDAERDVFQKTLLEFIQRWPDIVAKNAPKNSP